MSSILYQDRDVRDKWLKDYINEMNSKKESKQIDVKIKSKKKQNKEKNIKQNHLKFPNIKEIRKNESRKNGIRTS